MKKLSPKEIRFRKLNLELTHIINLLNKIKKLTSGNYTHAIGNITCVLDPDCLNLPKNYKDCKLKISSLNDRLDNDLRRSFSWEKLKEIVYESEEIIKYLEKEREKLYRVEFEKGI